jgi:hypothetical protein
MLFFPYFFQPRCPSWGIAFLVSTPGRKRWYATIICSRTAKSPSAAAAPLQIKTRQVMNSRFQLGSSSSFSYNARRRREQSSGSVQEGLHKIYYTAIHILGHQAFLDCSWNCLFDLSRHGKPVLIIHSFRRKVFQGGRFILKNYFLGFRVGPSR